MGVYENLLPGKENALTPEYLTVKCHFSSVRMLQKQIEAERKAGKVILSSTTPPGGYYLPAAGDTMEIRKFIRTLENRGENTLRVLESARELLRKNHHQSRLCEDLLWAVVRDLETKSKRSNPAASMKE